MARYIVTRSEWCEVEAETRWDALDGIDAIDGAAWETSDLRAERVDE